MAGPACLFAVLLLLVPHQVAAAVVIVLEDGRELSGASVERKGDLCLLELEAGEKIALPIELVKQIRLTDGVGVSEAEEEKGGPVTSREATPVSGRQEEKVDPARTVTEPGEGSYRRLYAPIRPATPSEQLAAFGRDPAVFSVPPVKTSWSPQGSLGYWTDITQFNPSSWFRTMYDPAWRPTSGYEKMTGPPDFNTSRWYKPRIRTVWRTRDGWSPTVWFPSVLHRHD